MERAPLAHPPVGLEWVADAAARRRGQAEEVTVFSCGPTQPFSDAQILLVSLFSHQSGLFAPTPATWLAFRNYLAKSQVPRNGRTIEAGSYDR